MAKNNDFVLMKATSKICHEFFRVLDHAIYRHGPPYLLGIVGRIRLAGSTLIPLHDRKKFLPCILKAMTQRHGDCARAAVNKEQHRIVAVTPSNGYPLIDSTDPDLFQYIDAIWSRNVAQHPHALDDQMPTIKGRHSGDCANREQGYQAPQEKSAD